MGQIVEFKAFREDWKQANELEALALEGYADIALSMIDGLGPSLTPPIARLKARLAAGEFGNADTFDRIMQEKAIELEESAKNGDPYYALAWLLCFLDRSRFRSNPSAGHLQRIKTRLEAGEFGDVSDSLKLMAALNAL